jgi:hypothetical protein
MQSVRLPRNIQVDSNLFEISSDVMHEMAKHVVYKHVGTRTEIK